MAQPETILRRIREAIANRASEAGQRNAIMAVLGEYGAPDVHPHEVRAGRMPQGGAFRVYIWTGTPAGDFALITGPTVEAEVKRLADIEVKGPPGSPRGPYVGLGEPSARVQAQVQDAGSRVQARLGAARMREAAQVAAGSRALTAEASAQLQQLRAGRSQGPVEGRVVFGTARGGPARSNPSKGRRAPEFAGFGEDDIFVAPGQEAAFAPAAPAGPDPEPQIEWAEGYLSDLVAGWTFHTIKGLDAVLREMAKLAPEDATYNKVKVQITKPDGTRTWTRVDLQRRMHTWGDILAVEEPAWGAWLGERKAIEGPPSAEDQRKLAEVEAQVAEIRQGPDSHDGDALLAALVTLQEQAKELGEKLKNPPQHTSPEAFTRAAFPLIQARQDLQAAYAQILTPGGQHYDPLAARGMREVGDLIDKVAARAVAYAELVAKATNLPGTIEGMVRQFMDAEERHQAEEPVTSWADEVERLQEVIAHFKRTVAPDARTEANTLVQQARSFGKDYAGLVNLADEQVRMWGLAPLQKLLAEAEEQAQKAAERSRKVAEDLGGGASSEARRAALRSAELEEAAKGRERTVHVYRHDGQDTVRTFVDSEQALRFIEKTARRDRGIGSVKHMEVTGGGTTIAYDPDGKLIRGKGLHPSHTDQAFTDTTKTLAGTFVPTFDPKGNPEGGPYLVHTRSGQWQVMLGASPISPEQDLERAQELAIRAWRQDRQKTVGPAALIVWDAGTRDGEGAFHRLGEYLSGSVPMRDPWAMKAQQEAREAAEREESERARASDWSQRAQAALDRFDGLTGPEARHAYHEAREALEILQGVNLKAHLSPQLAARFEAARKRYESMERAHALLSESQGVARRNVGRLLKRAQDWARESRSAAEQDKAALTQSLRKIDEDREAIVNLRAEVDEVYGREGPDWIELGRKLQEAANLTLQARTRVQEALDTAAVPAPQAPPAPAPNDDAAMMAKFTAALKAALAEG